MKPDVDDAATPRWFEDLVVGEGEAHGMDRGLREILVVATRAVVAEIESTTRARAREIRDRELLQRAIERRRAIEEKMRVDAERAARDYARRAAYLERRGLVERRVGILLAVLAVTFLVPWALGMLVLRDSFLLPTGAGVYDMVIRDDLRYVFSFYLCGLAALTVAYSAFLFVRSTRDRRGAVGLGIVLTILSLAVLYPASLSLWQGAEETSAVNLRVTSPISCDENCSMIGTSTDARMWSAEVSDENNLVIRSGWRIQASSSLDDSFLPDAGPEIFKVYGNSDPESSVVLVRDMTGRMFGFRLSDATKLWESQAIAEEFVRWGNDWDYLQAHFIGSTVVLTFSVLDKVLQAFDMTTGQPLWASGCPIDVATGASGDGGALDYRSSETIQLQCSYVAAYETWTVVYEIDASGGFSEVERW